MASIIINYSSKWNNSFCEEKNGKLKTISQKLVSNDNNLNNQLDYYKKRDIGQSTVNGLLYRLLGARLPLKVMLESDNHSILKKLINENKISFQNKVYFENEEFIFLRHKDLTDNPDGYTGVINNEILDHNIEDVIDVLFYTREEIFDYLVNDKTFKVERDKKSILDIFYIIRDIHGFKDEKADKENDDLRYKINQSEYDIINNKYKKIFNVDIDKKSGNLYLLAINKAMKIATDKNPNLIKYLSNANTFTGISLNGKSFTKKDFFNKFADKKYSYGNIYNVEIYYLNEETQKKYVVKKGVSKSNGSLIINIDCDYDTGADLKKLIENAGVSSFYLGKKGLAYVSDIII